MKPISIPQDCRVVRECVLDYVNNSLPADQRHTLDAHVAACGACRTALNSFAQVQGLLRETFDSGTVSREFSANLNTRFESMAAPAPMLAAIERGGENSFFGRMRGGLSAAPWWAVSVVLHGLVIMLAGLVSMAIALPQNGDVLITVTELAPRPVVEAAQEKRDAQKESALHSEQETPPTDPTSKELMNVIVPPELLNVAQLGEHFETINPDRPDTQSAFGNSEAQMFHNARGSDESEGGGGVGGSSLEDVIGVGGSGSPGSGGGWGGGNGTGIGAGNGSGRGSFGNRNGGGRKLMIKKFGGSPATEGAVERGLDWLARNQEPDGRWDHVKHGGQAQFHGGVVGDAAWNQVVVGDPGKRTEPV